MYCEKCGTFIPDEARFCPGCGQPVMNAARITQPGEELPMRWHKFLCYFLLWLGALMNVGNGVEYLRGSLFEEEIYLHLPGLRALMVVFGLASFLFVAAVVFTAVSLLRYKKNAPRYLMWTYVLNGVVTVLTMVSLSAELIRGGADPAAVFNFFGSRAIGSVIGSVVIILINKTYYDKRSHLFVN